MELPSRQEFSDETDGAQARLWDRAGQRQNRAANVPELEAVPLSVGGRPASQLLDRVLRLFSRQPPRMPADRTDRGLVNHHVRVFEVQQECFHDVRGRVTVGALEAAGDRLDAATAD